MFSSISIYGCPLASGDDKKMSPSSDEFQINLIKTITDFIPIQWNYMIQVKTMIHTNMDLILNRLFYGKSMYKMIPTGGTGGIQYTHIIHTEEYLEDNIQSTTATPGDRDEEKEEMECLHCDSVSENMESSVLLLLREISTNCTLVVVSEW